MGAEICVDCWIVVDCRGFDLLRQDRWKGFMGELDGCG